MRKRIQQLANGTFEYAGPELQLSERKIEIEVLEGKDYTGDFVITSANRVPMKGVIYTSNPRMECLTPQFEGEEVKIRYQFHSEGLIEGDIQKGEFFMICNQGEYNLSFVVSISRLYADSSIGKIKNLSDFAKLARESFDEAYHLFYSKNFKNIIRNEEIKEWMLYQGLCEGAPLGQKLEEFLIAIHKKKKVEITLASGGAEFFEVTEPQKESFQIKRSQWGYVGIRAVSDAPFLIPAKRTLTEEDFLGSVCTFEYFIDETLLHAGKNFGRITLESPGSELHFDVCASRNKKAERVSDPAHRQMNEGKIRLMKLYLDYRLKKIVTGVWANQSVEILDHLMALNPEEPLLSLMKAQVLIINKQKQEAAWIMDEFKRECTDRTVPVWGYYLYLCTLVEREPSYVDRLMGKIEEIFRDYPKSPLLFWILLFVREEYYRNGSLRLKAIERWVMGKGGEVKRRICGNKSPFFYLEAYYLLWQDPYLLTEFDAFSVEVLNWAAKQRAITKDIALQVLQILPGQREFSPFIYRILVECYRVNPEDDMIAAICAYLIRAQKFCTEYHKWYELGIEHELRITSLYEAYLMSMDSREVGKVPRMLQMYFQYNSSLSYQQRAILFVNIIAGKITQPEVYQKYRRSMEQFAMEQIEAGNMNDNLAVVYEEMMGAGILNKELAHRLSGILFTCKLTCMDKKMARAYVIQNMLKEWQTVTFTNGVAYFQAYTKDCCIVLEDVYGNRYAESIPCQTEPLLHIESYIDRCMELAPDEFPYMVYQLQGKESSEAFSELDSRYFSRILESEKISNSCKSKICPEIIRYYQKKKADGIVEKYLSELEFSKFAPQTRRFLTELAAEMHLFDKAWRMVQAFGYDYMESGAKVALCSYAIADAGFEEDDFLLGFAETTFAEGKYNDVILIYLCKFFQGATKQMAELWKAAGEFEIDTFDLEERILTQMLYSTDYIESAQQIYESYYAGGGRELICMAYLSYFSHAYLVKDALVPEHVFQQLKDRYRREEELNDACKLGLLKYLAGKEALTGTEDAISDRLLMEYTSQKIYFEFYKQFGKRLREKYQLYDKVFIEYITVPGSRVVLHYQMDEGGYVEEPMTEMYDGIFVKEITLFFGESINYYMTELNGSMQKVTESNYISNQEVLDPANRGKYARLNEMLFQIKIGDEVPLKQMMRDYYGMKQVTEEVFKLL